MVPLHGLTWPTKRVHVAHAQVRFDRIAGTKLFGQRNYAIQKTV